MKISRNLCFAIALIFLSVISTVQGRKCDGRGVSTESKAAWKDQCDAGECRPVRVPIPVDIPGYELVTPNTVMLKRCHSYHGCRMRHCINATTTEKRIKIEGWKRGMHGAQCMEYKTFEHEECKCGCKLEMCDNEVQDYDEVMCECTCKAKIVQECKDLIQMVGSNKIMIDHKKCECPCLKKMICANGEMFDKNMCRCVPKSKMLGAIKG